MRKAIVWTLAGAVCLGLAGCSTVNNNTLAADSKAMIIPAIFGQELAVGEERVEGEGEYNVLFGVFAWGDRKYADRAYIGGPTSNFSFLPDSASRAKAAAVYNALKKADCDLLIGTQYEVEEKYYFFYRSIKCKVSGYPAKEAGIRYLGFKADQVQYGVDLR